MDSRPNVVIIGAGFGGLQCARKLARAPVNVTLLDRHNYHLFTPLLYEVSTSLLNPSDVSPPIRSILRSARNTDFRLVEVADVDLGAREVISRGGVRFPYDYLVLATGSTTNFFANASVERDAHTVKELPDALEFRNHVLRCFEAAELEEDDARRRTWLTFVIVGAGPTGVEYAGALAELVDLVVRDDYRRLTDTMFRIILVEGMDRVLPSFRDKLGAKARRELERRGVEVLLGRRVEELDGDRVVLSDGETVETKTVAWAAGVKPSALAGRLELERTDSGRIRVDERLRAPGHDRVYAIGDIAAVIGDDGRELPMMAPQAMQEGRYVARAIGAGLRGKDVKPFGFRHKGVMATIGRNAGVAQIRNFSLSGRLGWLAYLLVHLYYLIGFRNRLAVFGQWAWYYLRYDRPIRIIARARQMEADSEPF
jgi:NADH dehydrogenase